MPIRRRLVLLACLAMICPSTAQAGEAENWARLKSMPRERRIALAKNLERFDALNRDERAQIRALDAHIETRSPAEQAHYHAVLRKYHLWVQSLPDDQKEQLRRATPGRERMILVANLRGAQKATLAGSGKTPPTLQLIPITPIPPVECAALMRDWLALKPAERADIEKRKLPARELALAARKSAGTRADRGRFFRDLPDADEATLLKGLEADLKGSVDMTTWLRTKMEPPKEAVTEKTPKKEAAALRKATLTAGVFKRHVLENYYFLRHPPKLVSPENLARFAAAMPAVFRPAFDVLPPDEARRRLTVIYRLVFPSEEMPVPQPATELAKGAPPKGAPAKGAPAKSTAPAAVPKGQPPQQKPAAPASPPQQTGAPF